MAVPRFKEFLWPVLNILGNGESYSRSDLENLIPQKMNLSIADLVEKTDGGNKTKVQDRLNWSRTYLKAAGLIGYPRPGYSQITNEGKKVLQENPPVFDLKFLEKYDSFLEFKSRKRNDGNTPGIAEPVGSEQQIKTPYELMDSSFYEIKSALRNEILSVLTGGTTNEVTNKMALFFERLVVKLLMKMGYGGLLDGEGSTTPGSGDGGIDGIIREDKLGLSHIYIQAKCYSLERTVSRPAVQTFVGAIAGKAGKGLFITTAKFSSEAKEYAKHNHIVLVDGDMLADLMIEYGVGVSTAQTYEIKKLDSDFFND